MRPAATASSEAESSVLLLAPIGRDSEVAATVLLREGIRSEIVKNLEELCERLKAPAAVILIAEEAINGHGLELLRAQLGEQETWSDIPMFLLTSKKERLLSTQEVLDFLSERGNVSILERPFRTITLATAVWAALRARQRQYEVRNLLLAQTAALKQRDDFLSIASHELKTPLTSLKIQVQMRRRLLNRGDSSVYLPEKVNALLNSTENQVERLSRLIDDMLDVSRIENGKLSLNLEAVELGPLVEKVMNDFSGQFQAVGSTLTLDCTAEAHGVWDRYRLEQVIANLFTNAIKYGLGKPIVATIAVNEGRAHFSLKDHGLGIAPADLLRVFDRFERAESAGSIGGLGLGLYISRQILDLHHGKIRVESRIGQGSTFTVELPLAERGRPAA